MNDVSFDEDIQPRAIVRTEQPALVRLVMRWGMASTEKGAHMVLLGATVFMVVFAITIYVMSTDKQELPPAVIPIPPSV